ncbi:Ldh family oxidoreductase [Roseomonas hellenica]|uniref:Ldh family oxidoreductase n=1 Tax=Plastoroseomonas hellenica TaxID=2687306 RepID=A0ABS5F8L2_9PROT|nr:Ldh family oxidoreductase [Plastoroseomonas hellenica]MBR0668887.1 Ldh family oxidoreductase [Plastoroseomonas hellenica]
MPVIPADRLKTIAEALLVGAGVPAEEAATVARHCIGANLAGHDSHGIIQIPGYIDRIKAGHIVPGAPWEIVQESPTTTVVDGHWGFGYVANERAMRLTIDKARQVNVAATTVFRQGHIGRLASYPLMAAEAGMIGLITADSGRSPKSVAPFGGREARLGTNPISIAVPSDLDGPLFIDMATSAVAMGKVKLAAARGEAIPQGWVVDSEGALTTDPQKLSGGALLPLGGPGEGYKGYGLAVMVEILCGLLTGLGFGVEPTGRHNDGCFMAVFKVDAFRPLAEFRREVGDLARYLKATPPSEGSGGVLYPGEIEHRRERERRAQGVAIEDATWAKLQALAEGYGIADALDMGARRG